MKSLEV